MSLDILFQYSYYFLSNAFEIRKMLQKGCHHPFDFTFINVFRPGLLLTGNTTSEKSRTKSVSV